MRCLLDLLSGGSTTLERAEKSRITTSGFSLGPLPPNHRFLQG